MDEDKVNANSEIRYLALELTKIAAQKKKPFSAVASEYVQNVHELQHILKNESSQKNFAKLMASQSDSNQRIKKNKL